MVGGIVAGLARGAESTLVHVEDRDRKTGRVRDECSVRTVERRLDDGSPVEIALGDSIWWQCGKCMWTPSANVKPAGSGQRCGKDFDIQLRKVGYSH